MAKKRCTNPRCLSSNFDVDTEDAKCALCESPLEGQATMGDLLGGLFKGR